MTKFLKIFLTLIFFWGTVYLCLPVPKSFPPLPQGIKSVEPGDTVQMANVVAYYTDMSRKEVLEFYTKYYSRSSFWGIPLITYRLNHPPERIREVLRATQQSTFVEEIVHPFRESVFVSGFEWNNDPFTPVESRPKNILIVNGVIYQFKITLFYQESEIWQRLIIFYLSMGAIYLLFMSYRQLFKRWKSADFPM